MRLIPQDNVNQWSITASKMTVFSAAATLLLSFLQLDSSQGQPAYTTVQMKNDSEGPATQVGVNLFGTINTTNTAQPPKENTDMGSPESKSEPSQPENSQRSKVQIQMFNTGENQTVIGSVHTLNIGRK